MSLMFTLSYHMLNECTHNDFQLDFHHLCFTIHAIFHILESLGECLALCAFFFSWQDFEPIIVKMFKGSCGSNACPNTSENAWCGYLLL